MDKELLKDIVALGENFTEEDRRIKAIEELSELIRALARNDRSNIIEELADSLIVLEQLKEKMWIRDDTIQLVMVYKMERTKKRLENNNI